MELLIEYANRYHTGAISRFEFRTLAANAINERFTADDVEKFVMILLQQDALP